MTRLGDILMELARLLDPAKLAPPVGSYLWCESDPAGAWPGTSWSQVAEGRYLVAAGSTYKAGESYGANTHKLTVSEMPSHSHMGDNGNNWNVEVSKGGNSGTLDFNRYSNATAQTNYTSTWQGGGKAHNNMPLSTAVPLWRRTA